MEEREKQIRNVTIWGAVVNIVLTISKLLAGIFGRSAAMVADGVHSLSDLLSDLVVLVLTHISSKDKDRRHSFGHGKFETMATLIVSMILIVVAYKLMSNGVKSIVDIATGETMPEPGYITLIAAAVSIIAKEILYQWTAKAGKKVNSTVVIANAWHHRSDALSSIGSLIGIGGAIILGHEWTMLDPIVSCVISVVIAVTAIRIAIPSLAELLETVEWDYPAFHLTMHCFLCTLKSESMHLNEHEASAWLTQSTLHSVKWLPADEGLIERIEAIL